MTTADHRDPDTLRSLYHDQGLTQTEIAEKLGVDSSVISRAFDEHDIDVVYNRSRRNDEHKDADTLRELYHEKGLTMKEIGKRFDVSGTTIRRWMNDLDVETRRLTEEDVVDEIQRLNQELGRAPTQSDMQEHGKHSLNCGRRKFGSWREAVAAAGFDPRPHGNYSGERNYAWKGGYEKYYGANWKKQRYNAVVRDQARCQDCGMTEAESVDWFGYKLDVHHIQPIKSFKEDSDIDYEEANKVSNLVTLCRSCHSERERGR